MYRLNTRDKRRSEKGITVTCVKLPCRSCCVTTQERKNKQSCLSKEALGATAGRTRWLQCAFTSIRFPNLTHSHTRFPFFFLSCWDFFTPFVPSSCVCIAAWWFIALLFEALYINLPVHWYFFFSVLLQFSRFGLRTCRKKEKYILTIRDCYSFYDPLHVVSSQRKMASGRRRTGSHFFILSGGCEQMTCWVVTWKHFASSCEVASRRRPHLCKSADWDQLDQMTNVLQF